MIVFESARGFLEVLTRELRHEDDPRPDEALLRPFLASLRRAHARPTAERRFADYAARAEVNRGPARPDPYADRLAPVRGPKVAVPYVRSKPLAPTAYERGWLATAAKRENQNVVKKAKLKAIS
jgi:hypothetical protein